MKSFFTYCLSPVRISVLMLMLTGSLAETYGTNFTVTSVADAGAGSLREAVTAANADAASPHVINFNISGSGVQTITLASNLPAITRTTTINGYSQPLASAGTFLTRNILIQLIIPATISAGITVDASNVVISGLNVVTAYRDALGSPSGIFHDPGSPTANNVWIWGCNFGTNAAGTLVHPTQGGYSINTYGNTTGAASTVSGWVVGTDGNGTNDAFEGNIFSPPAVTTSTVELFRIYSADNFVIAGNYFGLSADGLTPLRAFNSTYPQSYGISMSNCIGFRVGTDGNGTSDELERNIFAGITGVAVGILGNPPSGNYQGDVRWPNRPNGNNLIAGNYFGTDKDGTGTSTGLRVTFGVELRGATYTTIGSLANAAMRNVIVNATDVGISIVGSKYPTSAPGQYNNVYGNYIGVLADGLTPLANLNGINVGRNVAMDPGDVMAYKNNIKGNIIANNTNGGIQVRPSTGNGVLNYDNTFSQNSIYANGSVGINLRISPTETGVTPNDGILQTPSTTNVNRQMDYGVIKTASLSGNNLTIDGFIGINAAGTTNFGAGAVVEFFIADNTPANQNGERFAGDGQSLPHGEGRTFLGTLTANANGLFSGTIDVSGKGFVAGTSYITNTATEMAATGSTSEFGVNVTPLAIGGVVVIDGNGLSDNTVGGTGTNAGGTLFAALYDNTTGQVVDVVSVNSDGTYNFTGAVSSSDYSIYLTTTAPTEGQTAIPTITLPAGMNNTGEVNCAASGCTGSDGTPNGVLSLGVLTTSATATSFGINSAPVADPKSYNVANTAFSSTPPTGFPTESGYQSIVAASTDLTGYPTGGSLSGSDPEDCSGAGTCNTGATFNITDINANTRLFYDFGGVTGLVEIDVSGGSVSIPGFDPSKLVIYGQIGSGSPGSPFGFNYSMTDQAGITSATVPYVIQTQTPLPVTLIGFAVSLEGQAAQLNWSTTSEQNSSGFDIQRSDNASDWTKIGFLASQSLGKNSTSRFQYNFTDATPLQGLNYYRLKMVDLDESFAYSRIVSISMGDGAAPVLYPNPVSHALLIKNVQTEKVSRVMILNQVGRTLIDLAAVPAQGIDVSSLPAGAYIVDIKMLNGTHTKNKIIVVR